MVQLDPILIGVIAFFSVILVCISCICGYICIFHTNPKNDTPPKKPSKKKRTIKKAEPKIIKNPMVLTNDVELV
jgi:hypothetical protein